MKLITPYLYNDFLCIDVEKADIPRPDTYRSKDTEDILSEYGLVIYDKEVSDVKCPFSKPVKIGSYNVVYPLQKTILFVGEIETQEALRNSPEYKMLNEKLSGLNKKIVLMDDATYDEMLSINWQRSIDKDRVVVLYKCGTTKVSFDDDNNLTPFDSSKPVGYLNKKVILSPNNLAFYDYESNYYGIVPDLKNQDFRTKGAGWFVDSVINDLNILLNYSKNEIIDKKNEAEKKVLLMYVDKYIVSKKEEIRKENEEFIQEIESASATLINRDRRLSLNDKILNTLEVISNQDYFERQIELVRMDKRIENIEFGTNEITFYTIYLYAYDIKNNVYDIGKIKFKLNLENGAINFENLTHSLYKTLPHSSDSGGCFGSAKKDILLSIAKFNLADVVELVLNWCQSVNIKDTYGKKALDDWPKVKKEQI